MISLHMKEKQSINASFEESKGKDTFFVSKKAWKNSARKLKANTNFVSCAIKIGTIKTLMERFYWCDEKMLSSSVVCLSFTIK